MLFSPASLSNTPANYGMYKKAVPSNPKKDAIKKSGIVIKLIKCHAM